MKGAKYAEICTECQNNGWKAHCEPVAVWCWVFAGDSLLRTLKLLELQLKRTIRSILGATERAWWSRSVGESLHQPATWTWGDWSSPSGSPRWECMKIKGPKHSLSLGSSLIMCPSKCFSKSKKQSGNGDDSKSSFLKASSKNTSGPFQIYCSACCKEERVPSGTSIFHQRRVRQGSWAVESCLRSAPPQNRRLLSLL